MLCSNDAPAWALPRSFPPAIPTPSRRTHESRPVAKSRFRVFHSGFPPALDGAVCQRFRRFPGVLRGLELHLVPATWLPTPGDDDHGCVSHTVRPGGSDCGGV